MMFLSFAVAYWLSTFTGPVLAFLIVAGIHAILLALFIIFRKAWLERPLVQFLARLFMS